MSDEPTEQARVLSPIELKELKCVADRVRSVLALLPAAIHEGDTAWLYEICGQLCSDLDGMFGELWLENPLKEAEK